MTVLLGLVAMTIGLFAGPSQTTSHGIVRAALLVAGAVMIAADRIADAIEERK